LSDFWRVAREWNGETCFIVASGPSVASQDLTPLKGARVIAINSSWARVPFADLLFFGDARWFEQYGKAAAAGFAGRLATVASTVVHPRVLHLRRCIAPGIATSPDTVMIRRTSTTAAINLAVHLGVAGVVLIGVDNAVDPQGRSHHHAPHPWDLRHGWQEEQRADLESLVLPLRGRGVHVDNASPQSGLPWWPKISLPEAIANDALLRARHVGARG